MGWEDRQYYRDRGRSPGNIFMSILNGSVPLFTAFGIRVRVHASLIFLIVTVLLFDYSKGKNGQPLATRATEMGMLALIIILHEFGHCFAARSVGGTAEDVLLWPLGGLAFTSPPHRPWPTFVTVAGGPLVNVLICAVCAIGIWAIGGGIVSGNPFAIYLPDRIWDLHAAHYKLYLIGFYLFWLFQMSYILFLFNLLPIFPLDGGQILQSILWPKMGHYRSMYVACVTGMVGAGMLALFGLVRFELLLICVALAGFFYCRAKLAMLREMGDEFSSGEGVMDFSSSLRPDTPTKKRRRPNRWAIRRLRRQARRDAAEQQTIDDILAKVSAHGMHALTWSERRALKRATDRQRQRDVEMSRKD